MAEHSETGTLTSGERPSSVRTAPPTTRYWLAATIALVTWSCWSFPQTTLTSRALDHSWAAGMIFARDAGLQFGRDIVSTYGPLGVYSIKFFSPSGAVERVIFELVFGCVVATGICLVAWRIAPAWRVVLLGFFILVSSPMHWGGDALLVNAALFACGLICFLESGPRLGVYVVILVVVAAIGALVKITFMVTDLFTIGLLAVDLVLRRRRALAAGMVIGFVLAFLLGWALCGQSPSGLMEYLLTSLSVTSGYNSAMARSMVDLTWILGMTVSALVAVAVRTLSIPIAEGESRAMRSGPLLIWIAGLLFEEWKYGCVRSDFEHVALMFATVPIAAIAMEALPAGGKWSVGWSRAATILCMASALMFIHGQVPESPLDKFAKRIASNMSESFGVVTRPQRYLSARTADYVAERERNQLPQIRAAVGRAAADFFGQNLVFAIFNGLNYRPRPIFQSYAAYSRPTMELNEKFYLSTNAPEYVLFNLKAIDDRFPPLEDALVLRDLIVNYTPALSEADYLLLRRNGTGKVKLTLIKEGTSRLGEKIDLENGGGDASRWLEIEVQPNLWERMREFLYKPLETQLVVWSHSDSASPRKFGAPEIMLKAGFLASPLAVDNNDVMNIFTGAKVRTADAFSVELAPSRLNLWHPQIRFRIYRIENKVGPGAL